MPTMLQPLMDIGTFLYRFLIYVGFTWATWAILELPYLAPRDGTSCFLLVMLATSAPIILVFLVMALHKLLPHKKNLTRGFFLYLICVVNTINYICTCCIGHSP
jgi:hypothetical protein